METWRCEGWASGRWALAAHRRGSRPALQRLPVCVRWRGGGGGGGSWLHCTQLRTWLDGPASLSPGTRQAACSMMSPPPSRPGSVLRGGLAHGQPSQHLRWGRGGGNTGLSACPSPREAWAPPGTLRGGSQTSIEVTPIAKERLCHPQDQGQARGAVVSAEGPRGSSQAVRFH